MAKNRLLYKLSGLMTGALAVHNGYSVLKNFKDFKMYRWFGDYFVGHINNINSNFYLKMTDKAKETPLLSVILHLNDAFNKSLYNNFINDLAAAAGFGIATYFLIKISSDKSSLENKISAYEIKNLYTFKE